MRAVRVERPTQVGTRPLCCPILGPMTERIQASEAARTFMRLVEDVQAGEEIEIIEDGRAGARLVPAEKARSLKGMMSGIAISAEGDDLLSTGSWEMRDRYPRGSATS